MVVLRLIGDAWSYSDRLGVAIKPMESFKSRIADIQRELELESFVGYALYRTEGSHPHMIRATTPIDLSSNLTKEKLGVGSQVVVYVKQADLEQQSNDIAFHNGLEHFRRENGIKGLAKDGSDVKRFIEDLSTRLNIDASKDITDHEAEIRGRIEGEAHRIYWVLTAEFREVQALKDEEAKGRAEVVASYTEGLSQAYTQHVLLPALGRDEERLRAAATAEEAAGRAALLAEENSQRPPPPTPPPAIEPPPVAEVVAAPLPPPLPSPPPQQQPQIVMVGGGGIGKEEMEALMESMRALVKETQATSHATLQQMQTDFNVVVEALASDMKRSATEIQTLRAVVHGASNTEREGALAVERAVAARLEGERAKLEEARRRFDEEHAMDVLRWVGPKTDESAAVAARLLHEQNESLRALMAEEDAMAEQQAAAMQSLTEGYELGLYSEALNSVAVDQSIQAMHLAQTHIALELERIGERLRAVEQRRAAEEAAATAREERRLAAKARRAEAARANRTITVVTNGFCAVACSNGVFSYDDCAKATADIRVGRRRRGRRERRGGNAAGDDDGDGTASSRSHSSLSLNSSSSCCSSSLDSDSNESDSDASLQPSPPPNQFLPIGLLPDIKRALVLVITTFATPAELIFMLKSRDASLGLRHDDTAYAADYGKALREAARGGGADDQLQLYSSSCEREEGADGAGVDTAALAEAYLAALVLDTGGSSYELSDQLAWALSIGGSHPYRERFIKKLEESQTNRFLELKAPWSSWGAADKGFPPATPRGLFPPPPALAPHEGQQQHRSKSGGRLRRHSHRRTGTRRPLPCRESCPLDYVPFVDLLLAVYEGREVELLLSLCPDVGASVGGEVGAEWVVVGSEEDGGDPHYYNTAVPEFSQWLRPAELDE